MILMNSFSWNWSISNLWCLFSSRSDPESSDDQKKVGKLSIKKKGIGSEARTERMANADTDLLLLNNSERERLLQKQKKRRIKGREDDVCFHIIYFCSYDNVAVVSDSNFIWPSKWLIKILCFYIMKWQFISIQWYCINVSLIARVSLLCLRSPNWPTYNLGGSLL